MGTEIKLIIDRRANTPPFESRSGTPPWMVRILSFDRTEFQYGDTTRDDIGYLKMSLPLTISAVCS